MDATQPLSAKRHRCNHWAQIIGGILEVAGFTDFLGNLSEAREEFNAEADLVAALLEAATASDDPRFIVRSIAAAPASAAETLGVPAADWEPIFEAAHVLTETLRSAHGTKSKATAMGKFLSKHVGRMVELESDCTACLQVVDGRGRQKRYFFAATTALATEQPSDSTDGGRVISQAPPAGLGGMGTWNGAAFPLPPSRRPACCKSNLAGSRDVTNGAGVAETAGMARRPVLLPFPWIARGLREGDSPAKHEIRSSKSETRTNVVRFEIRSTKSETRTEIQRTKEQASQPILRSLVL